MFQWGFSHRWVDFLIVFNGNESCKSSVTNVDDVDEVMKMKIQSTGMGTADQQNTHTHGIMHIALSLSLQYTYSYVQK